MKIHVKKTENLVIPKQATLPGDDSPVGSAGYDVVALEDPKIVGIKGEQETWKSIDYIEYKTGLFVAPQTDNYGHDYHLLAMPRSSVRKYNLSLANCVGLIDNDYRGEIIFCFNYLWQPEDFVVNEISGVQFILGYVNKEKIYKKGDTIGQLVSSTTNNIDWIVVADIKATSRGTGGFGSTTDKKVEAPKDASSLIDKWKSVLDVPIPQKYEVIAKEREKLIP